jgi:acetyl esterase/lipase
MTASELELIMELVALTQPAPGATIAQRRERYERAVAAFGEAREMAAPASAAVPVGQACAEWARLAGPRAPVLLYLHGGSYTMGSAASHRHLARAIGAEAGISVLSLDYRRAPESPFPAAVEDAVSAYKMLVGEHAPAARIAVAGDSAGAGLAMALLQRLRASGQPLPAAVACLSPWTDLGCGFATHATHAGRDPLLRTADLMAMGALYLAGAVAADPLASPAFADLTGFPPMLIQVGTEEILLDDARVLAQRARAARIPVDYQEWTGMFHVWQYYFPVLSEGRDAVRAIGRFLALALRTHREPAELPGAS